MRLFEFVEINKYTHIMLTISIYGFISFIRSSIFIVLWVKVRDKQEVESGNLVCLIFLRLGNKYNLIKQNVLPNVMVGSGHPIHINIY